MTRFWRKWFAKAEPQFATLEPFGAQVAVGPEQTLLEAALAEGVPFPHSCTVGTCGSCKCRLVSGEVRAGVDFGYTLSKEEIQAGYILACQAHPLSAVVVKVESAGVDAPAPEKFTGRIRHRAHLTHDILAVTIELDRPIKYVAGQYIGVQAGDLPPRFYSFADPPERGGRAEISFFIRKTPGGAFTEPLFAGDYDQRELAFDGPHGHFYLRPGDGPLLCLAGGSGLAPLMSLLMDARRKNIKRPCVMLFGARTARDLYMLDAIEGMAADWLSDFRFIPVLSEEPEGSGWRGKRGFATDALADLLAAEPGLVKGAQAYMCGPPPMIDSAVSVLVKAGLDLGDIHYDKFSDSRRAE